MSKHPLLKTYSSHHPEINPVKEEKEDITAKCIDHNRPHLLVHLPLILTYIEIFLFWSSDFLPLHLQHFYFAWDS